MGLLFKFLIGSSFCQSRAISVARKGCVLALTTLLIIPVVAVDRPSTAQTANPSVAPMVTTVAGKGPPKGFVVADSRNAALASSLWAPKGLALDPAGNLFLADSSGADYLDTIDINGNKTTDRSNKDSSQDPLIESRTPRVRKIRDGRISTVAGGANSGSVRISGLTPIFGLEHAQGALFITTANAVFKVSEGLGSVDESGTTENPDVPADPSEVLKRVAGTFSPCPEATTPVEARPAVPATDGCLRRPHDIAFDKEGNMFIASGYQNAVKKVEHGGDGEIDGCQPPRDPCSTDPEAAAEIMTRVAGANPEGGFSGEGLPAAGASLKRPGGLAFDHAGNLYLADTLNHRIRKITPGADGEISGESDEIITTVAGRGEGSGPGYGNDMPGVLPTGQRGYSGDGGKPTEALLDTPRDVEFDGAGNLFVTDAENDRVRMITPGPDGEFGGPDDQIETVVGGGQPGGRDSNSGVQFGSGPPACDASCLPSEVKLVKLEHPFGLAIAPCQPGDMTTDVYFSEWMNRRVRKLSGVAQCPTTDLVLQDIVDSPDPVQVGDELRYAIEVANQGTGEAKGVALTGVLPPQVAFRSGSAPGGSCSISGPLNVACPVGNLPAGGSSKVEVTVTPIARGTEKDEASGTTENIRFEASISAANPEDPKLVKNNMAFEYTRVSLPVLPALPCLASCDADGGGGTTEGTPPGSRPPGSTPVEANQSSITVTTPPGGPGSAAPSTVPVSSPASQPFGQQVPVTESLGFQTGPAYTTAPASGSSVSGLMTPEPALSAAPVLVDAYDEQTKQPAPRYSMVSVGTGLHSALGVTSMGLLAAVACFLLAARPRHLAAPAFASGLSRSGSSAKPAF